MDERDETKLDERTARQQLTDAGAGSDEQRYGNAFFERSNDERDFKEAFEAGRDARRLTDQEVQENIRLRLSSNRELDGSNIEVRVQEGMVTLSGTVTRDLHRQVAHDVAVKAGGGRVVHLDLHEQR